MELNGIDPVEFLIIFMGLGLPFIFLILFVFIDMRGSKKSMFIYFQSEKIAEMVGHVVREGKVLVGKKTFYVDKAMPPSIRLGFIVKSFRPLYVIKHDKAEPFMLTKDTDIKKTERSPENLTNLIENKTLDQLLTPKNSGGLSLIAAAIGLGVGMMLMYILFASKIIHLS